MRHFPLTMKNTKLEYLLSESLILLSNTIFQHFILLQYAILLLIVSCKDDCVLESVKAKISRANVKLYCLKKKEELFLMKDGNVSFVFFFDFLCPCAECKQCLLLTHLTIAACVMLRAEQRNVFSLYCASVYC